MSNSLRSPSISIFYVTDTGNLYDLTYTSWQELANAFAEWDMIKNCKQFAILVSHQSSSYHKTFNTNYRGKEHAKDWIQKMMQIDVDNILESLSKSIPSNEDKAKAEASA